MDLLYWIAVVAVVFLALLAIIIEDAVDHWKLRRLRKGRGGGA